MRLIVDRTEGNRVICEQEDGTNIGAVGDVL